MSKVVLFERIRLARRDEGLSVRALAARFKVHRRDVRAALGSPEPPSRKSPVRAAPLTGAWHLWIREVLVADRLAPVKQRHTAKRIRDRLAREKGVLISESQCRAVVARVRAELAAGQVPDRVFVPQSRPPGAEGEVDWGKFQAVIGGETIVLHLFTMWLAFSTRAFHYAYVNEAQESFTDGHVRAFRHFGGTPRMVRYDNLKTAVVKVLKGRNRLENERFVALRSHYGFESFFCEPGIDGAHEKGGVEGEIGRFRRNHLTPVPVFDTLDDLHAYMAECMRADDDLFVTGRGEGAGETTGGLFRFEQGALWMIPAEGEFNATTRLTARVDTKARVCVRQCFYSVPARYSGQRVNVALGAETVTIIMDAKTVAVHRRAIHRKAEVLDLDHYLEVLWKRPGGLPASTALAQARSSGRFRPEHQKFWDHARRTLGDSAGTKALCDVLLLHRTLPATQVLVGISAALRINSADPVVVGIEARRAIEHDHVTPVGPIERAPSLADYDQLLTHNPKEP
jgi:transposase